MIKVHVFALSAIFAFLATPLVAHADKKQDPMQGYRDEIKRAQENAAQNVLDQLNINDSTINANNANLLPSKAPTENIPPRSFSNSEKAFSASSKENNAPNSNIKAPNNGENPWLKPNPWEAQAKINPWANVPIPSPGSATPSSVPPPPGPPNIFAPPHPNVDAALKPNNNLNR